MQNVYIYTNKRIEKTSHLHGDSHYNVKKMGGNFRDNNRGRIIIDYTLI